MLPYAQILAFVQQIAPTRCKPQHVNFAHTRQDRVRQDGRSGRQLSLL